jgi:hypothetical protein
MSPYPKVEKDSCHISKDERLKLKTLHFLSAVLVGSGLAFATAATSVEAKIPSVPTLSIEKRSGSAIVLTPASSSISGRNSLAGHYSHSSHASHASHHSHYSGR